MVILVLGRHLIHQNQSTTRTNSLKAPRVQAALKLRRVRTTKRLPESGLVGSSPYTAVDADSAPWPSKRAKTLTSFCAFAVQPTPSSPRPQAGVPATLSSPTFLCSCCIALWMSSGSGHPPHLPVTSLLPLPLAPAAIPPTPPPSFTAGMADGIVRGSGVMLPCCAERRCVRGGDSIAVWVCPGPPLLGPPLPPLPALLMLARLPRRLDGGGGVSGGGLPLLGSFKTSDSAGGGESCEAPMLPSPPPLRTREFRAAPSLSFLP